MLFFGIFIALTAVVVMLGVQKGIEKVSKFMMPLLLVLIVGISIYTLTLPGAIDGLIYYIKPDFSEFSIKTVIAAVGQLFYSMSAGNGHHDYLWFVYAKRGQHRKFCPADRSI